MRLRNCAMMALAVAGAMMLTACGGGSGTAASQAAGGKGGASASEQTFNLKLSHGLAEDHAVHIQMTAWAEAVKEKSNGTINIQILPNGQLGSEAVSYTHLNVTGSPSRIKQSPSISAVICPIQVNGTPRCCLLYTSRCV